MFFYLRRKLFWDCLSFYDRQCHSTLHVKHHMAQEGRKLIERPFFLIERPTIKTLRIRYRRFSVGKGNSCYLFKLPKRQNRNKNTHGPHLILKTVFWSSEARLRRDSINHAESRSLSWTGKDWERKEEGRRKHCQTMPLYDDLLNYNKTMLQQYIIYKFSEA